MPKKGGGGGKQHRGQREKHSSKSAGLAVHDQLHTLDEAVEMLSVSKVAAARRASAEAAQKFLRETNAASWLAKSVNVRALVSACASTLRRVADFRLEPGMTGQRSATSKLSDAEDSDAAAAAAASVLGLISVQLGADAAAVVETAQPMLLQLAFASCVSPSTRAVALDAFGMGVFVIAPTVGIPIVLEAFTPIKEALFGQHGDQPHAVREADSRSDKSDEPSPHEPCPEYTDDGYDSEPATKVSANSDNESEHAVDKNLPLQVELALFRVVGLLVTILPAVLVCCGLCTKTSHGPTLLTAIAL